MIEERNIADDDINKTIMGLLMKMRIERDGELMIGTKQRKQQPAHEHAHAKRGERRAYAPRGSRIHR